MPSQVKGFASHILSFSDLVVVNRSISVAVWDVIHRCMNVKTVQHWWVSPSSGGKTRQRGEIENVNVWLMAEEEGWRYNTKSIKDNFRPKTLETQALNHEVIHSDWSRSVVITWECYMWLQGWLAELSRDSKLDLMDLRWCAWKSLQKVQRESSKHFTSI